MNLKYVEPVYQRVSRALSTCKDLSDKLTRDAIINGVLYAALASTAALGLTYGYHEIKIKNTDEIVLVNLMEDQMARRKSVYGGDSIDSMLATPQMKSRARTEYNRLNADVKKYKTRKVARQMKENEERRKSQEKIIPWFLLPSLLLAAGLYTKHCVKNKLIE